MRCIYGAPTNAIVRCFLIVWGLAGVCLPSNLLVGRFRIGEAVLSSVEAVFVGIAFGIGLYY